MSKVTLRIIAEQSGMSKYAVSRALSGKDGVSETTRARILEIAETLGYRAPATPKLREIAALFDDPHSMAAELHTQILGGLQRESHRLGYVIRAHWLHHDLPLPEVFSGAMGVIAINLSDPAAQKAIRNLDMAVVYTGWQDPLEPVDIVSGADHESGSAVARHLIGLGHKEIVYVHGREDLRGRRERLYGLREIVERTPGIVLHDLRWTEVGGFSDAFTQLLTNGARPTALFCAHDGLALNAVTDVLSRGWRIPTDLSVVGFGDFSAARQIRPALSTVRVKGDEMGRTLLNLLHRRLTDEHWPRTPMRLQVTNELLLRSSCGRAPWAHPLDRA